MRAAGSGQPLLSAWLDRILQRHRCRIKDWPSSQAAKVCDLIFALLRRVCFWGYSERDAFWLQAERFVQPLLIADALCAGRSGSGSAVDIFDANSGLWTTAALSVARWGLAATSLPNQGLAIFAGGHGLLFSFCD